MTSEKFRREIKFSSAREGKNSCLYTVRMAFYLHAPELIVQFVVYTGWTIRSAEFYSFKPTHDPLPADVGYHSPVPIYGDEVPMDKGDCEFYEPCYYGGSSSNADDYFELLIKEGSDGVWKKMEEYYEYLMRYKKETDSSQNPEPVGLNHEDSHASCPTKS